MTTELSTPHSLDAEKAVLGALLLEDGRFLDVADRLMPADFFRDAHQRIFAAVREMATAGHHVDALTVMERLRELGALEQVGGPAYLFGLLDGIPRNSNLEAHAAIVKDRADKARLSAAAQKIQASVQTSTEDARTLIDRAEHLIFALAQQETRGDFVPATTLVTEGMVAIEKLLETKKGATGLPTGFADLDAMTRGLHPGALVLVAARPSMGKTAWALNVAAHVAAAGTPVGFFSLEMSRQELFMRLVASVGRIDGHRLLSGYVSQSDYGKLSDAFGQIGDSSLYVDDTPTLGILDLRGKARRLKAKHGLGLLVVDYLQLMQLERAENRNLAVAEASRALKLVARELQIPVVALSQLSRATEQRGDKRPMLSDLRDSGALEQDADLVLFIHRPEVYQATPDNAGLAEIVIAKQRNGPTGIVKLHWSKAETRFADWSQHE